MKYHKLGKSNIEVSEICFGCWGIIGGFNWGDQDVKDSVEALQAGFESGINFYDTAEMYGEGSSEALLARALGSKRSEIVIASKVWPTHYEPSALRAACEGSLKSLDTDYIDLYMLHWPNDEHPLEESIGVLKELKSAGKIREYGVSNFATENLKGLLDVTKDCVSNQLNYSLLFRAIEDGILAQNAENDISVVTYSSICQGLLSGKYCSADELQEDRARTRHFSSDRAEARHSEAGHEALTFETIDRIRTISETTGISMVSLSLAWLLSKTGVTSVIAGARTATHAKAVAAASGIELSSDVIASLDEATSELKAAMGPNADMWQSTPRLR